MTEKEKLIFACMWGKDRSPDLQSLAKQAGHRTELLFGGLDTFQHVLKKLAIYTGVLKEGEDFTNTHQVHQLAEVLSKMGLEKFDALEIMNEQTYYRSFFTEILKNEKKRKRKFIVTIDYQESNRVQWAVEYLRTIGEEVIMLDQESTMVALMLGTFEALIHPKNDYF